MGLQYAKAAIEGGFWQRYRALVRESVLPYQWKALNDLIPGAPKSHSIENFRIASGLSDGQYDGMVFQDSDLYKWLEAAGHLLGDGEGDSREMLAWVDETVDLIARAQQPDGYLNTYFTVKEPGKRWKNLREAHELYCAGHLIEAGVAVFRGTGNQKILEVARRLADHIDSRFGAGKIRGYCGHEEVELALVKLYRVTGERRYLDLARYFVDERGRSPNFFEQEARASDFAPVFSIHDLDYYQARVPVRELADASGHAVRAMYLCVAVADLAIETGDEGLRRTAERLWSSAAERRMYVTGGIGSAAVHEAFTVDYDLPNDTAYAETCAAIGLFFFSHRLACLTSDSRYADVMERTLYNGVASGLALDGRGYFYVNPLEVVPELCDKSGTYHHVKYRRQPWYGCACCPPNIARLLASLGEYVYHIEGGALYADLFHEGSIACTIDGRELAFRQTTGYPWEDSVAWEFSGPSPVTADLAVRIPGWCRTPGLSLNGARLPPSARNGYAHVKREWRPGDRLELSVPMPVERVYADPRVRADLGKVAIQRGPIVYCLEQADNGPDLRALSLPAGAELRAESDPSLLGGVVTVSGSGLASVSSPGALYGRDRRKEKAVERKLLFVPYYAWANREPGEMAVWIREEEEA